MTLIHIVIMIEAYFLMLFCIPLPIICTGNAAGIFLSAAALACTVHYRKVAEIVSGVWQWGAGGKILVAAVSFLIAFAAAVCLILSIRMLKAARKNPPDGTPHTVIVLGCRVHGDYPGRMLRKRLRAAGSYLEKNPQAVCIVSGGRGSDEEVTEAYAMKKFLISLGISGEKIYTEDRSRSTYENLSFSFALAAKEGLAADFAIATDAFHQYRAAILARQLGKNVSAISSQTAPLYAPTYWVREWFGLLQIFCKKSSDKFKC